MTLRSKAFLATFLVVAVFILASGFMVLLQYGKDSAAELSLRRLMSQTFAVTISEAEQNATKMVAQLRDHLDQGEVTDSSRMMERAQHFQLDFVFVIDPLGRPVWRYVNTELGINETQQQLLITSLFNQIKLTNQLKNGVAYFEQEPLYLLVDTLPSSQHRLVAGFYLQNLFSRLADAYGFQAHLPLAQHDGGEIVEEYLKGEVKLPGLISKPVSVWIEDHSFQLDDFSLTLLVLGLIGLMVGVGLWWFCRVNFVLRIESMIRQAHDINTEQAYHNRIKLKGDDELTELVGHYNSVISTLEYSYNLMVKSNLITTELISKVQANTELGSAGNEALDQREEDELRLSLDMVNRLSEAVEHDAMELYFQPVVDANSEQVIQVEALCRWFDEDRGMVPPLDFLALAEKSGQMPTIARQVIRKACRAAKQFTDMKLFKDNGAPGFTVSVNLSLSQFVQPNLITLISEALQEFSINPEQLELEIKEHTLARDLDKSAGIIGKLHEIGVGICIDDFGLSKFSLMYLQRLPISKIKLSKSFVDRLERNPKEAAFIDGIARFSKGLNIRVIAKGVQSQQQLYALEKIEALDCQGYALARPMGMEQFLSWLQQHTQVAAD